MKSAAAASRTAVIATTTTTTTITAITVVTAVGAPPDELVLVGQERHIEEQSAIKSRRHLPPQSPRARPESAPLATATATAIS